MNGLVESKRLDGDRLVAAIATAIGISQSPAAFAQWQASRDDAPMADRPMATRAPMDSLTLGLVLRQFPSAMKIN